MNTIQNVYTESVEYFVHYGNYNWDVWHILNYTIKCFLLQKEKYFKYEKSLELFCYLFGFKVISYLKGNREGQ